MNLMKKILAVLVLIFSMLSPNAFGMERIQEASVFYRNMTNSETEITFFDYDSFGNDDAIKKFLESPDNVIYDQDFKNKLLCEACIFGGLHVYIEPLVKRGADINMKRKGIFEGEFNSILHFPTQLCNIQVVEELLKCKINPNTENSEGLTSLQKLATRPIYFLEDKDINKVKKTVCLLLEYGANPYLVDKKGNTPIDLMRKKGFEEIAQIMENYKQHRSLKQLCLEYIGNNSEQWDKLILEEIAQKIDTRIIIGSCSICFGDLDVRERAKLDCSHDQFHVQCIEQWKETKPGKATCPMCRAELN